MIGIKLHYAFLLILQILQSIVFVQSVDYTKIDNDPGVDEMKQYFGPISPNYVPKIVSRTWNRDQTLTQIVAKYEIPTGRCDCYNATSICQMDPLISQERYEFFIQSWCLAFLCYLLVSL